MYGISQAVYKYLRIHTYDPFVYFITGFDRGASSINTDAESAVVGADVVSMADLVQNFTEFWSESFRIP